MSDQEEALETQPSISSAAGSTLVTDTSEMPPINLVSPDEPGTDWDWPSRSARPGVRLRIPTIVLLALLCAAGGLWGGAALQRSHGVASGSSTGSAASLFANLGRSRTGRSSTGAGGFPGGTAPAATGEVTSVIGSTIYVTNTTTGVLYKIVVGPSTTITRETSVKKVTSVKLGDTVVVEGTAGADHTVKATSVAATAPGVRSIGSFFGGG